MRKIIDYLKDLNDERKDAIIQYHLKNLHLIKKAKGSSNNHQAWQGGYEDHIEEGYISIIRR